MKTNLPSHAVRARRYFYGTSETTSIAFVGSREECRAFIERDDDSIYHLANNESGRWTLRVVRTNSLSPYARQQAEQTAVEQSYR